MRGGPHKLDRLLPFITAAFIRGVILRFLTDHGVTENNYRNQRIPSSVGVLIW